MSVLPLLVSMISKYSHHTQLVYHACCTLCHLIRAGTQETVKSLMEEEVMEVMNDVLQKQKDVESVKVICEVVVSMCKQGSRYLREAEWMNG